MSYRMPFLYQEIQFPAINCLVQYWQDHHRFFQKNPKVIFIYTNGVLLQKPVSKKAILHICLYAEYV